MKVRIPDGHAYHTQFSASSVPPREKQFHHDLHGFSNLAPNAKPLPQFSANPAHSATSA